MWGTLPMRNERGFMRWCCAGFENMSGRGGSRGVAVLVDASCEFERPRFFIQFRATNRNKRLQRHAGARGRGIAVFSQCCIDPPWATPETPFETPDVAQVRSLRLGNCPSSQSSFARCIGPRGERIMISRGHLWATTALLRVSQECREPDRRRF